MRRMRLAALTALALPVTLLPFSPAQAAEPTPAPALQVTGFALGSLGHGVLHRDAHALTTVTVAGVAVTADGRGVAAPTADVLRLARSARRHGLRTELLLSNYSNRLGGFDARRAHRLLDRPASIRRVAKRLARLVADQRWDGVNVDLELVRRGDAAGLVALVDALQAAMPAARTVTIDISASTSVRGYRDRGYALGRLGSAVDVVELMAYDQHGPTWSGPGPVGALGWQRDALEAVLTKVPAAKVDLGVAGYGYSWPAHGTGRSLTTRGARTRAAAGGVRPVWHPRAGEWSARLSNGTVLWWSDARSYRARARLAREYGVHGLALWRLGSADPL